MRNLLAAGLAVFAPSVGPAWAGEFHISVDEAARPAVERALAAARAHRTTAPADRIVIDLPPGIIRLESPIVIGSADSGVPGAELVLRGDAAGKTVLSGGVVVPPASSVTANRIALTGIAFPPPPPSDPRFTSPPRLDAAFALYQGEQRIVPARLPADGYMRRPLKALDQGGRRMAIAFEPATFAALASQKNLWIAGYPAYDWQHEMLPVVGTDPATDSLIVERTGYQFPPKATGRVAVLNGAFAPAVPGTAQIDLAAGTALISPWPSKDPLEIIRAPSVLSIEAAGSVWLEQIAFEKASDQVVTVRNSRDIRFSDCSIGQALGSAITVTGGANVELRRCVISDTGTTAAGIGGGDRPTLTRGDHRVVDSIVSHVGIIRPASPGIAMWGVGQQVQGSLITDGGHWGVQLSGNDHLIEGNEFTALLRETEDSGVLYMGRDWTQRGNRIVGNYMHDFGLPETIGPNGNFGVYLDDQFSSADIHANIIVGGRFSVFIGGGRDNRVTGNLFVAPKDVGVFMDDRGKAWQPVFGDENSALMKNFRAVDVNAPIWRQRYPELAALPTNNPGAPVGNVIEDNVAINAPVARGWRRSAAVLMQENRSLGLKATAADIASANSSLAFVARKAPSFPLPILADRRAALAGLLFVDRAGLDQPR